MLFWFKNGVVFLMSSHFAQVVTR